jgi:hypothetical protein
MSSQINRPLLFKYFEQSEQLLLAEYARSKLQQASQNLGSNRELFCNSFLSRVLPHSLKISRGEIWDGKGNKTGQLDTIIVRDDTPSLAFGDANTYLIEGVFAVIEIKSNLTRQKLQESIETLKPVSGLSIHQEGVTILSRPPDAILDRPLRCIFAYEGASWELLLDEIEKQTAWDLIDLICILDKGALIRNGLFFRWQDHVKFGISKGKAVALGMLYFFLATFLTDFIARTVSVRPYFEPFGNWSENGGWLTASMSESQDPKAE